MKYTDELRLAAAKKYYETGKATATANEFGVSRKSVYIWGALYKKMGAAGLAKKTTKPKKSPKRTDPMTEKDVCNIWIQQQKRNYSAVKRELEKIDIYLSVPTIKAILERLDFIQKR